MQNWNKFTRAQQFRSNFFNSPFLNSDEQPSIVPPPNQDFLIQINGDYILTTDGDNIIILT